LSRLSDIICDYDPPLQEPLARLWEAASLVLMVRAVWEVVRRLAVCLVEESLTMRAQQSETWPAGGRCGRWLQRLSAANAAHVVGGDRLATAGRAVSEGRQGLTGCAVGSGVGVGAPPTHRGGSAVDGLSVGGSCAL
jgi:hypothetical protein